MRRKKKAPAVVLVILIAALTTLIAARACNNQPEAAAEMAPEYGQQVTGKLEKPADSTPSLIIPRDEPELEQVELEEEKPARAARFASIEMTEEERDELAAIVYLEAGNQSAEGQQAVVEVVFNRVLHSAFPDTVHDVLHQGENSSVPQFSTIYMIDRATPTQAQYDAIDGALYGDTILDADVVFFSRGGENSRVWGQIGDHVFCREYIWE